ncbi:MAG: hypothetical protein KBS55_06190 [Bacteroidales bacterium]|nr:hypothetical protein [Candidatus Cryptobacteroides aphodequi]
MKRLIVFACLLLAFAQSASAQPRSFGLRGGIGLEMSYQHARNDNFLEIDLGVLGDAGLEKMPAYYPGLRLSAAYDFTLFSAEGKGGAFAFYLGPGATFGLYGRSKPVAGILMQVGIEYDIPKVPVALAIDFRPNIWFGHEGVPIEIEPQSVIPMGALRWKF